jgi:hypothetical protein
LFVKTYDEFLDLESKIFNWDWTLDWSFIMLTEEEKMILFEKYFDAEYKVTQLHYWRNQFNTNVVSLDEISNLSEWIKMSNAKSSYHQFWVWLFGEWNTKYISPDWKMEIIVGSNNQTILNPKNVWTYNFFDPNTEQMKHLKYDIEPYERWWNSSDDTTNKLQRSKVNAAVIIPQWFIRDVIK